MARKKIHEEHENLERWLVSYADFITLLFAFFVVMYAISSLNEGKYRVLSDSLVTAFREQPGSQKLVQLGEKYSEMMPGSGRPIGKMTTRQMSPGSSKPASPQEEKMKQVAKEVISNLAPLLQKGEVRVSQTPRGLMVEISASALFASGEARLQPEAVAAVASVAKSLAGMENSIQVEGHTDNVPINVPQFPSNWELSSARAGAVVRLLTENGVPSRRLVALGYADNKPVEMNDSAAGRARNRRVNVIVLNLPSPGGDAVAPY